MTSQWFTVALPLAALYAIFWLWYGGRGKPMGADERERLMRELAATDTSEHGRQAIEEVRELMASDDGREFVMMNLARYRSKALYPPGSPWGDDPREADRRYGKSIIWPLLSNGNLVVFIARRSGAFITPPGADAWHYVAMVRYRSRRDFLRFAIASNQADRFIHKWAALEKTHVFPVTPIISLIMVRSLVALLLMLIAALAVALG